MPPQSSPRLLAKKAVSSYSKRTTESTSLQQIIPSCARPCFDSFVKSEYTCSPGNLSCLCSRYSSQGFTLGELAYGCSYLHCQELSAQNSAELYDICASQSSAVPATHSTVTLPTTATTYSGATSISFEAGPTTHVTSSTTSFSSVSHAAPSFTSAQSISIATSAPSQSSIVPSTTASPPTTTPSHSSNGLTTGQAAGVSVAAMGALGIIIALILCCFCCRRRRRDSKCSKHDSHRRSYDCIKDKHTDFAPFLQKPSMSTQASDVAKAPPSNDKALMTTPYAPHQPSINQRQPSYDIIAGRGLHVHRAASPDSRVSNESMRTVSQLLPEKPGTTPPLPAPVHKQPRSASIFTTATIFEEHNRQSSLLSPTLPPTPLEKPKPTIAPKRPARPEFAPAYTTSPDQIRQPTLSLDIPRRVSNERIPAPIKFPPPPPIPQDKPTSSGARSSAGSRIKSSLSSQSRSSTNSYLPNYYTSAESRLPAFTFTSAMSTPIENQAQTHRPIPVPAQITITRPTYPPKAVRASTGSDTSFESTDPDEPTPPSEEEKQLSPVAESPLSAVRYPKVPRSSNQTVPRSPKPKMSPSWRYSDIWPLDEEPRHREPQQPARQTTNPVTPPPRVQRQDTATSLGLSSSTLAAKRRGEGAAHTLERGLHINDSVHSRSNSRAGIHDPDKPPAQLHLAKQTSTRQESPLKGYGRRKTPPNARPPPLVVAEMRKPSYTGSGWGSPAAEAKNDAASWDKHSKDKPVVQFASSNTSNGDVYIRSPLWEPKLTPSRRGEDLYLSVGVQTPITPGFGFGQD